MRFAVGFLVLVLVFIGGWSQQEDWESTRRIAESQHEIVMLHIEKGQFKQAVEEARKIFYLPFPSSKQALLTEEAKQVSDALIHYQQHNLAREVLDEALLAISEPHHQAVLYKEKGYLLKKMGREEEAMSCFKKAVELDNQGKPKR